jgi:hypothetical protein
MVIKSVPAMRAARSSGSNTGYARVKGWAMFIETYCFDDANRNLLSQGTAIRFPTLHDHEALIDYSWDGKQVLLEARKEHTKPIVTNPEQYRDVPFDISRCPSCTKHGLRIVQHAHAEIGTNELWNDLEVRQSFVSRAYSASKGSQTRNIIVGAAIVVLGVVGIAAASSPWLRP